MNRDAKNPLKELCPEAFFVPQYPKTFKFNLVIGSKDYGELKLRIDKGLEISNLTGSNDLLSKIAKIGKRQKNKAFYISDAVSYKQVYISYPFRDVLELITAFAYEEVKQTNELEDLKDFVKKVRNPLNTDILYQKTGIFMTD